MLDKYRTVAESHSCTPFSNLYHVSNLHDNIDICIKDYFYHPKIKVFIDEVQKNPKLLDVVHKLIFEKKIKFALTGSSVRKLKRDSANLLAGSGNLITKQIFFFQISISLLLFGFRHIESLAH